ncbi:MAG: FecR family protein [Tannerella sp.]|jgi:ferric-dicitrate binding protein FerR (iron transport regulator)|nr:FecR family protein [Tannerella sp.]
MDRDLLYRFFEGHASVEEMKAVKEWVDVSEENNKQFRRERKLFNAMILVEHSKQPGILYTKENKKGNGFIREVLKIASVVVITAGITISLLLMNSDKSEVNAAMQTVTVPAGQRVNLSLPDGSNIWLNAGSQLQYPISFMEDKREVILDGEAYFEVAHNEKCPFIVRTHVMDIEVLGTTFNVDASLCRNTFEASLIEGKINVKSPHDENVSMILLPDHKVILMDGELVAEQIDNYDIYRWKEGLYCFKSKAFADIIKDLERYYDIRIIIDGTTIENVKITGKFRISDGLDYALNVLKNDVSFTYYRDINSEVIYIK